MKLNFKELNFLLNGWGIVTDENGNEHFVFVPLWDPAPMSAVGKAILATLVIKNNLASVTNKEAKAILKTVLKEQAKIVAGGFAQAMDIDGEWCGTKVPHRIPGTGPIPHGIINNPLYSRAFGHDLTSKLDAKAAVSILGKVLNNEQLTKAADLITTVG